jgi:hypothetical protein
VALLVGHLVALLLRHLPAVRHCVVVAALLGDRLAV